MEIFNETRITFLALMRKVAAECGEMLFRNEGAENVCKIRIHARQVYLDFDRHIFERWIHWRGKY